MIGYNVLPSLGYKRRGKGTERVLRFAEDEVLPNYHESSSPLSLPLHCFPQTREAASIRGKPVCFQQRLHRVVYVVYVCAWVLVHWCLPAHRL